MNNEIINQNTKYVHYDAKFNFLQITDLPAKGQI